MWYFINKRNENDKNNCFDEKQQKCQKGICKSSILCSELAPLTGDENAPNFRDTEKIYVIRNCQWNTLLLS